MLLLIASALLVAWILVALATVALCVASRRGRENPVQGELAPVIQIRPAA